MTTSIETLHRDLVEMRKDLAFIKNVLAEDFELSKSAGMALEEARQTAESEYVDLE